MKNTMRRIWAARALACGLAFGALAVERPPVAAPALEIPRVGMATLGVEEVTAVDAAPRVIAAESFRELKAWQPSGPSGSCAAMADADARTFVRLGQGRRWGFPHGVRPARPVPVVPSSRVTLSFQGRVPPGEASFVVYLRLFDAAGADVTEGMPAPSGWAYSDVSKAFYMAPLAPEKPHAWETFSCPLAVPEGVAGLLPFICPWRGEYVDCTAVELALRAPHRVTPCVFGAPEAVSNGVLRVTDPVRALRLEARTRAVSPEVTEVEAQVIDLAQPPRPRALRVTLALAADFAGGVWHRDLRTDVAIAPGASCAHAVPVGGHPVSRYPFDAASKNGRGVALGTPFDAPAFEARQVSERGIRSAYVVGLLARGRGLGTSATLRWTAFPFAADWGFRSAARTYYAVYAAPFARSKGPEGAWLFPIAPSACPTNTTDFGLAFWEAPTTVEKNPAAIREAHARGIGVFPYTEVWGMRQRLETRPDGSRPSVAARLAELKGWAATNAPGTTWFDAPRQVAAQAALNALPVQPDGTHPFAVDKYDGWFHWWRTNADPRLARPNRASLCWDYTIGLAPDAVDGIYLDSVAYGFSSSFNNVRPEHLAVMDEPLVWDVDTARPCANGIQHQVAFVTWAAGRFHALGKRIFGNVFEVCHRFHATTIDIFGREVGAWGNAKGRRLHTVLPDADANEQRFFAYRRPVANLLQEGNFSRPAPELSAEQMRQYVENQMFYGFYPGVSTIGGEPKPGYAGWKRYFGPTRQCERDRALFKAAMPVIRNLNRAGWEPVTGLRSSHPDVWVERFGAVGRGAVYVTVRNASARPATATLAPDAAAGLPAPLRLVPVWNGAGCPSGAGTAPVVSLRPWETAVFRVDAAP